MSDWRDGLPPVRGRLLRDEVLAPFTWLRVGGPADLVFLPADIEDLAQFLRALPRATPVTSLGVGSNTLVRDGGVEGVVVRLGKPFAEIRRTRENQVFAGAAALGQHLARAAAEWGVAGLEFLSGVPGSIGGALVMNAGCYGSETKDVLVEAYAVTRDGETLTLGVDALDYSYRRSGRAARGDLIFTGALFQGQVEAPETIQARIAAITERREASQPIRAKTGGSTFKNPPGKSAWELVDAAGWRGKRFGGAMFSPLHANFLINAEDATAADLEGLVERVRADVLAKFGVELEWEVKRIGRPAAATPPPPRP